MTNFRTTFKIKPAENKISYQKPVFLMGSCFTENIGNKLFDFKFQVLSNPFGIIFNPISLAENIEKIINENYFSETDLIQFNNKYISLNHHGNYTSENAAETLKNINNDIGNASKFLKNTAFLIITFGTAWVYEWKETGKIVANCHKIPQNQFIKRLLNVEEIVFMYRNMLEVLQQKNPEINVLFTVSPIRHVRDGVVENQLSKSILHVAIHEIIKNNKNCSYFPAYEIVMDDLRDYRFYEADMIHPNKQAIEYIWEIFKENYIDQKVFEPMKQISKIHNSLQHRPIKTNSLQHRAFIQKLQTDIENIQKLYPFLDFSTEITDLQSKLS